VLSPFCVRLGSSSHRREETEFVIFEVMMVLDVMRKFRVLSAEVISIFV